MIENHVEGWSLDEDELAEKRKRKKNLQGVATIHSVVTHSSHIDR